MTSKEDFFIPILRGRLLKYSEDIEKVLEEYVSNP